MSPLDNEVVSTHSVSRFPSVVVRNIVTSYPVKQSDSFLGWGKVRALDQVSFVAYEGESIGLFGENGSGKSTLMKVVAGVERPEEGEVLVSARPTLMGVKAALQPRLSGSKNIRLGCYAMGLTPEETEAVFQEIVELADISDAIERPMNTYSSGQAARLRFAIGLAADPDILIIDETLSTGDAAFAKRAGLKMKEKLESAGTVFLVSHSIRQLQENCQRGLWLHDGRIIADGPISDVSNEYRKWVAVKSGNAPSEARNVIEEVAREYRPPCIVLD